MLHQYSTKVKASRQLIKHSVMGFTINEKITTELTYKDIALIAAALGMYQEQINGIGKDKMEKHARDLVNRLGAEMYDVREEDDETRDSNCTLCDVRQQRELLIAFADYLMFEKGVDFRASVHISEFLKSI